MKRIYHIAPQLEIERAARTGHHTPATLLSEGFIHCSYAHQLERVAARYFHGQQHLALLEIDPRLITAPIVNENFTGELDLYPHIYGPLPMSAVTTIRELVCRPDGSFEWPCLLDRTCAMP
jgi:uncharacterized protein (DUF952 family)